MRRFDRSYEKSPHYDDERRVTLPKEANWLRSSLENFSTMHNELSATVARNYDHIMIARQENVVIAENVRAAAAVYNQLSDRLSRVEDQVESEKKSLEEIIKNTKLAETHITGQQRQLLNRGMQMERNSTRLEEEVMRLKQTSEMNSRKIQSINDKIDEELQQMLKKSDAMDFGIQDLRQLCHETEINSRKNIRIANQEIEHKIQVEEKKRKSEHALAMEKIQVLQTVVNDIKKRETNGLQNYAKLIDDKDQEYRKELNNLFEKISAHIHHKQNATSHTDKKLIHQLTTKVRLLEEQLLVEKEARVESLIKLEDETARHFKKVSNDIISELDKLSSSLQNTHSKDHMETVIREMKKEIQANKQTINRVLRAEITARKSQAEKFSNSIQGVQKHSSQTVIVVEKAIKEMKTYVDKELGTKSVSPDENANYVIPTLEKRLSDLEEKLSNQQKIELKSPSSPEYETDMTRRLYELEMKISKQIEFLESEKSKKRGSSEKETYRLKHNRTPSTPVHKSCASKDRLIHIEKNIEKLSSSLGAIELKINKFKRLTMRDIRQERKKRNKFIEFINSRLLAGERLKIFVKSFGVHHMKYFTQHDGKQKACLNIWGVYQAWRMYEYKKKWLKLINKEPTNLDLKSYRKLVREEKINERIEAKKVEKKRKMSTFVMDSFSESSEESEKEEETEKERIDENDEVVQNKETSIAPDKKDIEEGPKRINYEEHHSDDNYIQYKTDEEDDDNDDETEEFFPVTSSEEDFKLFSDEDDDDDDTEEDESDNEEEMNGNGDASEDDEKEEEKEEDKEEDEEAQNDNEQEDDHSEENRDQLENAQRN